MEKGAFYSYCIQCHANTYLLETLSLKVISSGEEPAILILDLAPLLAEYQKRAEKVTTVRSKSAVVFLKSSSI